MKTKKLACQGCGADLDPIPGEKYIDCAYCGTTNVLVSDTVHLAPGSGPRPGHQGGVQVPQIQIRLPSGPSGAEVKKAGKIIALVVLSVVIGIVGIGATVFIRVFRGVSDARKQHREAFKEASQTRSDAKKRIRDAKRLLNKRLARIKKGAGGVIARIRGKKKGAFHIESDRPLTADLNDDGIMDLMVRGNRGVVAAIDGTSAEVLWKKSVSGSARKIFYAGKLVLVAHGEQLTALAAKDGMKRWSVKLPDRADLLELRGTKLAIETGDDELLTLDLATGKKQTGRTAKFMVLSRDDGRKWMSNLGRSFRLKGRKRRARLYYCPHGQILKGKSVTRRRGPFTTRTTTYGCRAKRALVWALDKRGRKGFIIGLQKGRGKIWEHQLAGRARRYGGNQPLVGMHGDLAAVAHKSGKVTTLDLLSRSTGKRRWTKTFSGRRLTLRGVVVTAKRVFVRVDSWVEILDVATGKPPVAGTTSGAALPAP